MKKFLILLCASMITMAAIGCGGEKKAPEKKEAPPVTDEKK